VRVEAFATSIPPFLLLFAGIYAVMAAVSAGNFSDPLTRTPRARRTRITRPTGVPNPADHAGCHQHADHRDPGQRQASASPMDAIRTV